LSYYCDTSGGNSGSPVFSARTGYAIGIHSHGGCRWGRNWGGWLGNAGIIDAFDQFQIPYVDRANATGLFQYETFVQETQCKDHSYSVDISVSSLANCQKLCVASLTCVGVEYDESRSACGVNYRSQARDVPCQAQTNYYSRPNVLTTSLNHNALAPDTTTTTTTTITTTYPTPSPTPTPTPYPTPEPTPQPTPFPSPAPTPEPTDFPTPAPTPATTTTTTAAATTTGLCKQKCFKQKRSWSKKCKKNYCAGCDACASMCANKCSTLKAKWKRKCKKAKCAGCGECAGLFEDDEFEHDMDESDIDNDEVDEQ